MSASQRNVSVFQFLRFSAWVSAMKSWTCLPPSPSPPRRRERIRGRCKGAPLRNSVASSRAIPACPRAQHQGRRAGHRRQLGRTLGSHRCGFLSKVPSVDVQVQPQKRQSPGSPVLLSCRNSRRSRLAIRTHTFGQEKTFPNRPGTATMPQTTDLHSFLAYFVYQPRHSTQTNCGQRAATWTSPSLHGYITIYNAENN